MVSGSQLQVAKLAQMCPVVPSSAQQRMAAPSGNPGQNPTWGDQRHQTVATSAFLEQIILFTSFLKNSAKRCTL